MNDPGPDRLYSWKEIASYLEVSVRTAQLWERDRGLPVHRLPGPRGRAYAIVSELEAWVAGESTGSGGGAAPEAASADPRRRNGARMTAAVAVVIALAVVWTSFGRGTTDPATATLQPERLVVFDGAGNELWTFAFPHRLWLDRYESTPGLRPTFADIDGDGASEVLVAAVYADRGRSSVLHVFAPNGELLWTHRPGMPVSTATEAFDDVYWAGALGLLQQPDGTRDVLLAAHHHIFYPNVLTRLSAGGAVRGRYWSAGHLGSKPDRLLAYDLDADGSEEVLLSGINNAREAATLVVLDPDRMEGAGHEDDARYRFLGLPAAEEIARVLFPRSAVTPPENRYTLAGTIRGGRRSVTVSVLQSLPVRGAPAPDEVLYTFGPGLELLRVSPADNFVASFRREASAGRIDWELEEELERLGRIRTLRSATRSSGAAGAETGGAPDGGV